MLFITDIQACFSILNDAGFLKFYTRSRPVKLSPQFNLDCSDCRCWLPRSIDQLVLGMKQSPECPRGFFFCAPAPTSHRNIGVGVGKPSYYGRVLYRTNFPPNSYSYLHRRRKPCAAATFCYVCALCIALSGRRSISTARAVQCLIPKKCRKSRDTDGNNLRCQVIESYRMLHVLDCCSFLLLCGLSNIWSETVAHNSKWLYISCSKNAVELYGGRTFRLSHYLPRFASRVAAFVRPPVR